MYWFLLLDVTGNRPGWSVYIVLLALWIFMYQSFIFLGLGVMILPVLTVSTVPYQVYGQTGVRTT